MTLYFKKEHFKTSIPVAITAMLVMYTLNNSIASKLPQTSNIKFIDIWIVYGLSLHFLILVLLILMEHPPERSKVIFLDDSKSSGQRINVTTEDVIKIFARKLLPLFETLFVVCYFLCACAIYNGLVDNN